MGVHFADAHVRKSHDGWATNKNAGPHGASLTVFPYNTWGILGGAG